MTGLPETLNTDPQTHKKRVMINGNGQYISANNANMLLKHCLERIEFGNDIRESLVHRLTGVDRELSGFIVLDADDTKRARDNARGKSPKVHDVNLTFTAEHLERSVTYALSVIAGDDQIYEGVGTADEQAAVNSFTAVMNDHAEYFQHYRHLCKAITDQFRYNFGGSVIEWVEEKGNTIEPTPEGNVKVQYTTVMQGNCIDAIDPYNFIWDPTVHPCDLYKRGEFFATVEPVRKFQLQRMASNNEIFNVEEALKEKGGVFSIYKEKPDLHLIPDGEPGQPIRWDTYLSGGSKGDISQGYELTHFYCHINPKEFGLPIEETVNQDMTFQVWRISILNCKYIVAATPLLNAHGHLPISIGTPIEDNLGLDTKSYGERLLPLQRFANHLFNTHQRANRKALNGTTYYDPEKIPIGDYAPEDLESAHIPAKNTGLDFDIRKAIFKDNDVPVTQYTMQDISNTIDLMQFILPSQDPQQVANLDRATQYQAAAYVQGSNRQSHKITKIIHTQYMQPMNRMQITNVMQYQPAVKILDQRSGERVEVNPRELRSANIQLKISDGLKGIDRLLIAESIREIINVIIQSNIAIHRFDIVKLVNYWTSLVGEYTDFSQFQNRDILDTLDPQQRQIAAQLYERFAAQQAAQQNGGALPAPPTGL